MTRARNISRILSAQEISGDINLSGIVTATEFYGDGSNLTGVGLTADTSTNSLVVSGMSTLGNVTAGVATFSGDVTIGGVLTYDDVTNVDSLGIITARSDISIADKIIHTGDTNTAIRFPAADTFTVETNGSERIRVNNAGRVGVGDDDPNVPVNIKGAPTNFAGIDIHLKLEDTTSLAADVGGTMAFEGVYTSGGAEAVWSAIRGAKENATDGNYAGYFSVLTRPNGGLPTERLRVTSAGNIGIGTDDPQVDLHLHDSTNTRIQFTDDSVGVAAGDGVIIGLNGDDDFFINNRESSKNLLLFTENTERVRITSGGNLGIGSAAPTFLTDILSGVQNTGANINNPSQLSVTGPNKTLTGGGANVFINSNSDLAADTGGSIAFSGRNTTSSTNSIVHATIKGAKENATSANADAYLAVAVQNHSAGALVERMRITSTGGVHFNNAELIERVKITSGKLSDNTTINLDNGMVHYFTTTETTTAIPNITTTAGINTNMATGDTMSVTIITTAATAGYSTGARIDAGSTLPVLWNGGSDPSTGGSGGVDAYTYQIIKTGDAAFTVLGNVSNFA